MKKVLISTLVVFIFLGIFNNARAQKLKETTIILVRHAEKDPAGGADPDLSAEGKLRAQKLIGLFKDLKADEMYSTPYIRTKETLKPWATKAGLEIKIYDPRNLKGFADELKLLKGKTVVVAGHSNTTPALANFLLGNEKYKALDDSVYSTVWILTIKDDGSITDKTIEY
ncbi:MAG TPA: phosphoglycerate mutase family protein [Segetibacter sp.]|jgi:phosphohistidine phosphatase SixA